MAPSVVITSTGLVYYLTMPPVYIVCVNSMTREIQWERPTQAETLTLLGDALLLGSGGGQVIAFNAYSGDIVWHNSGNGRPILGLDRTVFSFGESSLRALSSDTGDLLWQINLPFQGRAVVVDEAGIAYVRGDSDLAAVDPFTKEIRWQTSSPPLDSFGPYAFSDGTVAIFGKTLWRVRTSDGQALASILLPEKPHMEKIPIPLIAYTAPNRRWRRAYSSIAS